jgi:hypothetical protein
MTSPLKTIKHVELKIVNEKQQPNSMDSLKICFGPIFQGLKKP